jgi:hypothetical protein
VSRRRSSGGEELSTEARLAALLVAISALTALAANARSIIDAAMGRADLLAIAIRFAVMFLVVRLALGLLVLLYRSYRDPLDEQRLAAEAEADAGAAGRALLDDAGEPSRQDEPAIGA